MKELFFIVLIIMTTLFVLSCDDNKKVSIDEDTGDTTVTDEDTVDTGDAEQPDEDKSDTVIDETADIDTVVDTDADTDADADTDTDFEDEGDGLTYYVHFAQGDDNNNGNEYDNPLKTLRAATWKAKAGDTIILKDGFHEHDSPSYNGAFMGGSSCGGKASTAATYSSMGIQGTPRGEDEYDPKTWVKVKAEHAWNEPGYEADGQHAIFDGENYTKTTGIGISGCQYVLIEGVEIRKYHTNGFSISERAASATDPRRESHHIILRNNHIHHLAEVFVPATNWKTFWASCYGRGSAVFTSWKTHHVWIDKNIIHNNGRLHPENTDPHGVYHPAGIDPRPLSSDPDFAHHGKPVTYAHEQIFENDDPTTPYMPHGIPTYFDTYTNWKNHDHSIYLHGSYMTVTNNIIHNTSAYNAKLEVGPHSVVSNNLFYNSGPWTAGSTIMFTDGEPETNHYHILVMNNIFYNGMVRGISSSSNTNIRIYNNLAIKNPASTDSDGNYPTTSTNASTDGNFDIQDNLIGVDPKFVDPTNGDFTLQPDSPCLTSGRIDPVMMRDYNFNFDYPGDYAFQEGRVYEYKGTSSAVTPAIPGKIGPSMIMK